MTMDFSKFKEILNNKIFEDEKASLLTKISKYPERYIGLFRPTKPYAKLIQNVTQSHEIRFGDALESVIKEYATQMGYKNLGLKFKYYNGDKTKTEDLDIDQLFQKDDILYLVEQKVRDDHDSTKKRGQINNFEIKLDVVYKELAPKKLVGIMFFIDPSLNKNKKFYSEEIIKISRDYGFDTHIFYGSEFFDFFKRSDVWEEILSHLENWKENLAEIPEVNFDLNPETSCEELKKLSPAIFRKLFDNEAIKSEILPVIFPTKATLKLLADYWLSIPNDKISKTLANKINEYIEKTQ